MKQLEFSYAMDIHFSQPALQHCFSLRCLPFNTAYQMIREMFVEICPNHCLTETTDGFGNRVLTDRIIQPHTDFSVYVTGTAEIDAAKREQESLNCIYKYPSVYTKPDKALLRFAEEIKPRVQALSVTEAAEFIYREIRRVFHYQSGATTVQTTAAEAFRIQKGVCQDYAHIFIALCRIFHIPARYVVGIIKGVGETHAWAEVYADGIWLGVDPTNDRFVDESYLKLSHGRDFADCGVNRGVLVGGGTQTQKIKASLRVLK